MSILDIVILVILAYFGFSGFRNGLLREVLGLAGVVAGLFLAFRYLDPLNGWFVQQTGLDDAYAPIITFTLIFLLVIIATQLIIISLEYVIEAAFLSVPNRILGLSFGVLKSGLFISLIFLLLSGLNLPGEKTKQESALYPYVLGIAPVTYNIVGTFYPGTEDFYQSIQKTLDKYHIDNFR